MSAPFEPGRLLGAIISASPDAVVVVDTAGRIVLSSPAVERLFGYYPDELVGEPVELLVPEERRDAHVAHRTRFGSDPHSRPMGAGLQLSGRRRDGRSFPIDVSLAPVEHDGELLVAAFVRDATARRRAETQLQSVNEITQSLLGGRAIAEILPLVAARARSLVEAAASWIVTPSRAGRLVIAAADGEETEALVGVELAETANLSGRVMDLGLPELVEDLATAPDAIAEVAQLGLGPGLYVPLLAEGRRLGALVVGRERGGAAFSRTDVVLVEVFGAAAAVGLALAQARAEVHELQWAAEHDRIARDLHDTVIQRLFALGMSLEAVRGRVPGLVGERIGDVVEGIDGVIREIRTSIFRLQQRSSAAAHLRDDVLELVEEASGRLGFLPRVGFRGPVDVLVGEEVAGHLLAVLREALSNVVRHARATSVQVVVLADGGRDGAVTLSVADDGVGLPDGPTAGEGLRNMAARAEDLGGELTLSGRQPSGTLVEWRVPARS